jgi:hypothetical protein
MYYCTKIEYCWLFFVKKEKKDTDRARERRRKA